MFNVVLSFVLRRSIVDAIMTEVRRERQRRKTEKQYCSNDKMTNESAVACPLRFCQRRGGGLKSNGKEELRNWRWCSLLSVVGTGYTAYLYVTIPSIVQYIKQASDFH